MIRHFEEKYSKFYAQTLLGGKSQDHEFTVCTSQLGSAIVAKDCWKLCYYTLKDIFQLDNFRDDYSEEKKLNDQFCENSVIEINLYTLPQMLNPIGKNELFKTLSPDAPIQLSNLDKDLGQKENIFNDYPEKVAQMHKWLLEIQSSININ